MREYILYVILVFLPIGAIMAYMLQREGVSRRNTAIVVAISWLIIVTFPLSIAKLGTFIALLAYIVAILVMTRYLLGNKKEFVVESKGTLVTGNELEQLMVDLERQGYNISTDTSGNFVSISDEQAINSMIARQTAEAETAEIPEPATLLAEIDNIEIPIEDIAQETAGDIVAKPDIFSRLEAEAVEALLVDISDKDNAEEEKVQETLTPESATGDAPAQPDAAGDLSADRPLEETELTGTKDSEPDDWQEDMVVPAEIEIDDLESKIRDASDSLETLQAVPELEPWTEPEPLLPISDEEPHPEEVIETLPEEAVAETRIEPEKAAEQEIGSIIVESISEAITGEPAAEIPEAEDTVEAEPAEQPLPSVAEALGVAGPDVFEKESETWTESDDTAKTEETTAQIVEKFEQEEVEKEIAEASGSEIEEPAESMEMEDAETIDEAVEEETQETEQLVEVMLETAQIPAELDLDETPVEAARLTGSVLSEAGEPATAGLDLAETEIVDTLESDSAQSREEASGESEVELAEPGSQQTAVEAELAAEPEAAAALDEADVEPAESLETDSDQSFEEADSDVEEPAEEIEIEDSRTIDEAVEEEMPEAEQLAGVMPETAQIPAEPDLGETPIEAVPIMESIVLEAGEPATAGLDLVETEIIDILESDSVQSREEAGSEPEVEFAEPESRDAVVEPDFAAEPESYEITGEPDIETEKPESGVATVGVDNADSAELQESPEPVESLADQAEPTELEIAEESADATEAGVEPELLTDQIKEPDQVLFELIDRGFALKEMGNWQEAGQCFMDADALTEDAELKELLNMEIVGIFRLLS